MIIIAVIVRPGIATILIGIRKFCLKALEVKEHPKTYINEIFSWDHTIDDLLSICYYYENNMIDSLKHINNAIKYLPNDERLLKNKKIIETKINS
jgi:hypothetical protein